VTPEHGSPWLVAAAWWFLALTVGCRVGYTNPGMDAGDSGDAVVDTAPDRADAMDSAVMSRDAGICTPAAETCNGIDDDCDGSEDEDFDLDSDLHNCGECGNVCPESEFASATCVAGTCGFECNPGFADCDGSAATGCETNLRAPETCGDCDRACAVPLALCQPEPVPMCVSSCDPGFALCDESCVDTEADRSHCGTCGIACESRANATVECADGSCTVTCSDGFGDCDLIEANGCETALTSLADCGACGVACDLTDAIESCTTGSCEIVSCTLGRGNCDGMSATGCESSAMHFWPDVDLDTWGDDVAAMVFCDPPYPTMEIATRTGDCDDDDPLSFPGAGFQATANLRGNFDYNCDGSESPRWRTMMLCISGPVCLGVDMGWEAAAGLPLCGATALWVTSCSGAAPCTLEGMDRTQECR